MSVFDYPEYKQFVNNWIASLPRGGHGELRRIAHHLKINSVIMSQVFRGDRDLTLEQALGVTKYMGLTEPERDFFLLLVQKSRAGNHELKSVFEKQLDALRTTAQALKNIVKHQQLTDENKTTFYSQWYYSAVRLGVSIPNLGTVSAIADYLKLDRSLVVKVVEFLLKHGLVVEENGRLSIGPQVTHIGHDSPFVMRHHTNWRLKSLQRIENITDLDLFYTGPMALSVEAAKEIRRMLVDLVGDSTKKAASSNSEALRCLNIDWFGFGEGHSR